MANKRAPKLVVEDVKDRGNLFYLSLIEYKGENYISIIDNFTPKEITAYVLDVARQEGVDLTEFFSVVNRWFYSSARYPLSIAIAKEGLTKKIAPIHRTFDANYVVRVVGHAFVFDLAGKSRVRRRRAVQVPSGVEIILKKAGLA